MIDGKDASDEKLAKQMHAEVNRAATKAAKAVTDMEKEDAKMALEASRAINRGAGRASKDPSRMLANRLVREGQATAQNDAKRMRGEEEENEEEDEDGEEVVEPEGGRSEERSTGPASPTKGTKCNCRTGCSDTGKRKKKCTCRTK